MLLLMDGTLMRGDDARRIQLCDLFLSEVDYTRPHPAVAMGAVSDQGKANRVSVTVLSSTHVCEACLAVAAAA